MIQTSVVINKYFNNLRMKYDHLDAKDLRAALVPLVSHISGENTPRDHDTLDTLSFT